MHAISAYLSHFPYIMPLLPWSGARVGASPQLLMSGPKSVHKEKSLGGKGAASADPLTENQADESAKPTYDRTSR
jgi:hypothetical protein